MGVRHSQLRRGCPTRPPQLAPERPTRTRLGVQFGCGSEGFHVQADVCFQPVEPLGGSPPHPPVIAPAAILFYLPVSPSGLTSICCIVAGARPSKCQIIRQRLTALRRTRSVIAVSLNLNDWQQHLLRRDSRARDTLSDYPSSSGLPRYFTQDSGGLALARRWSELPKNWQVGEIRAQRSRWLHGYEPFPQFRGDPASSVAFGQHSRGKPLASTLLPRRACAFASSCWSLPNCLTGKGKNGAARVTRTPDLRITNAPLYRLSYGGPKVRLFRLAGGACQAAVGAPARPSAHSSRPPRSGP